MKRSDISKMKNRYLVGLDKLNFAASQVSVMQQELTDLQPELIKTSEETEKLMVKIEQDTVEVEAKKEVRWIFKVLLVWCRGGLSLTVFFAVVFVICALFPFVLVFVTALGHQS